MNKLRGGYYIIIFLAGGFAYCFFELLYRGRTHWSMFIAGGICVSFLYLLAAKSRVPVWKKWLAAGAVITTVEFITGGLVNIMLGWQVWDYSRQHMNLMGQICPLFSIIWTIMSIPMLRLFEIIDGKFSRRGGAGFES